jgi:rSAM/selenodomain-associated transferase 2
VRLAVLIAARNEAERLPALLESLRRQTEPAEETILADGGSTDGTRTLAAVAGALVFEPPQRGRGQQFAAAAAAASAELLLFAHADMTFAPRTFAAVRAAFRTRPALIGGCCGHRFAEPSVALRLVALGDGLRARWLGRSYGDQAQFCRADWLAAQGGYPPQGLMEDVELARRLRHSGAVAYLDAPATVSGRSLLARGVAKSLWRNWRLRRAYARGADPEALRREYYR